MSEPTSKHTPEPQTIDETLDSHLGARQGLPAGSSPQSLPTDLGGQANNEQFPGDQLTGDHSFELSDQPADSVLRSGAMIGPFKLLQPLGKGGMGEVWMAEQFEPVKRRVALKVIKHGMGSKDILARFEAERQALALMNHPNIARILDAGTTPDGQPYFAMELVQGKSLTAYCDANRLSIDERLRLFADVCHGIQHAHQKGIIHRDLKPSNILVAVIDGKVVPKVIDFGLAKALESTQRLTDQSLFTGIGQILGTLKYMSPEQASLDTTDVDTRTDIYALGVILYELLTGSTPLDDETIRGQAALKVLEFIRDKEPAKPSSRLGSGTLAEVSAITERRKIDTLKLSRALSGDLDWIVMKALEKDRTRRYESASGFAADVQRFLSSEPVTARPPSLGYRASKFIRKHRMAVSSAAAVLLTLTLGVTATSVGMYRARQAERLAEQKQEDLAASEAEERRQRQLVEQRRMVDHLATQVMLELTAEGIEYLGTDPDEQFTELLTSTVNEFYADYFASDRASNVELKLVHLGLDSVDSPQFLQVLSQLESSGTTTIPIRPKTFVVGDFVKLPDINDHVYDNYNVEAARKLLRESFPEENADEMHKREVLLENFGIDYLRKALVASKELRDIVQASVKGATDDLALQEALEERVGEMTASVIVDPVIDRERLELTLKNAGVASADMDQTIFEIELKLKSNYSNFGFMPAIFQIKTTNEETGETDTKYLVDQKTAHRIFSVKNLESIQANTASDEMIDVFARSYADDVSDNLLHVDLDVHYDKYYAARVLYEANRGPKFIASGISKTLDKTERARRVSYQSLGENVINHEVEKIIKAELGSVEVNKQTLRSSIYQKYTQRVLDSFNTLMDTTYLDENLKRNQERGKQLF